MGWVVMSERELNRVEVLAQVDGEWLIHQNPRIVHSLENVAPICAKKCWTLSTGN